MVTLVQQLLEESCFLWMFVKQKPSFGVSRTSWRCRATVVHPSKTIPPAAVQKLAGERSVM